jgi:glutathione synthase/RimK-type ligase-like ATP-grasp enzyme
MVCEVFHGEQSVSLETVVLATCETWPELSPSDQALADALRARGVAVTVAPWNGPFAAFEGAQAVVIRATWDYHMAIDAYRAWLDRLDPARTFNAPALVRWNLEKSYLLDLAARGANVPKSRLISANTTDLAMALRDLEVTQAVIKPMVGASGFGVQRVGPDTVLTGDPSRRLLVQEFLPEIADGELAGVFFDGRFSHALRRVPASGDFRVNSQYGGRMVPATVTGATVAAMQRVIGLVPGRALYARVDGLIRNGEFVLMEVEVNEPALGLHLAPGAAERFCDALYDARP